MSDKCQNTMPIHLPPKERKLRIHTVASLESPGSFPTNLLAHSSFSSLGDMIPGGTRGIVVIETVDVKCGGK